MAKRRTTGGRIPPEEYLERGRIDISLLEEKAEVERRIAAAARTASAEAKVAQTRIMSLSNMASGRIALQPEAVVKRWVEDVQAANNPNYNARVDTIKRRIDEKRSAVGTTSRERFLTSAQKRNLVATPEVLDLVDMETRARGRPLGKTALRKYLNLTRINTELVGAGLTPTWEKPALLEEGLAAGEKMPAPKITGITGGKYGGIPGMGAAGQKAAMVPVEKALSLLEMPGAQKGFPSLVQKAGKALAGGRLGRLGMGGGLLALLLGPALLGRKQEQQELPPLLQLQLLQAIAQMQQEQGLADSLMGSRAASAERNLAQADLLRMKALAQGPSPVSLLS